MLAMFNFWDILTKSVIHRCLIRISPILVFLR